MNKLILLILFSLSYCNSVIGQDSHIHFIFAYSETDEDFDKMPYILKVPADESPIDIHRLIRFYMELDLSPRKIRDSIKNLSWKEQMMKVINNL